MHRIDSNGATADHLFTAGDPSNDIMPTDVSDQWLNDVQENIARVIELAGIALVKGDYNQLAQAITDLIEAGAVSVPVASEEVAGIIKRSTNAQALEGADDATAMSPADVAAAIAAKLMSVPVRQTVLSGYAPSGTPAFLAAGAGLAVNLLATAIPLVLTTAAGFGAHGAVDTITRISADLAAAWSGLAASSTSYLYIDTTAPNAPTYGASVLAPVYAYAAPAAPAADQHWFDLTTWRMWRWSGTAWVAVPRVFVGECLTGAAAVTSVTPYAFMGRYISADTAHPGTSTTTAFSHNIGVQGARGRSLLVCQTADQGYSPGDTAEPCTFNGSDLHGFALGYSRLAAYYEVDYNQPKIVSRSTPGTYQGIVQANWKLRIICERGF